VPEAGVGASRRVRCTRREFHCAGLRLRVTKGRCGPQRRRFNPPAFPQALARPPSPIPRRHGLQSQSQPRGPASRIWRPTAVRTFVEDPEGYCS